MINKTKTNTINELKIEQMATINNHHWLLSKSNQKRITNHTMNE